MPVAVTDLPARSDPPHKQWTRDEVVALSLTGLFEDQKFELIDGELISTMGKRPPHVICIALLHKWLVGAFGWDFVLTEAPIDVAPQDNRINEPEPDLVVLKQHFTHFATANPQPEDVRLLIEVANTTLAFDRRTKAALYARAGIADCWVLDIPGRRMIVHRSPQAGSYTSVVAYSSDESVSPLCEPQALLRIRDALPQI